MISRVSNIIFFTQEKEEIRMPWEQAIRIVQIHERARQGRLRAKFMREIRQQEDREKQAQTRGAPTLDHDVAAMRIQKVKISFRKITNLIFLNNEIIYKLHYKCQIY